MVLSLPGPLPKAMAMTQPWAAKLISVTSVTTEVSAATFSLGHYVTGTRIYSHRGHVGLGVLCCQSGPK